ncbi:Pre-rRNA-processing protein TSR2 [Neolecta irregularis DAH-3]|uniref:Pre-rRNA-processing protein TSR2 n=1 Tax=Neolecta irregularis (strain DAH-3) TaxID=1198029 RepID=A0A1U7LST3_NEOID|nr:Pre-rRNA-processing protein TSR2 [Neolecta irregularis DAH-3]|eukprot:OLL25643.1 Pre-rRNA-processing protein TSR2 [Neolecta irregularis DAH-3]
MENVQRRYFELGVALILYKWTVLRVAVENHWGGPDSGDKRDWLAGAVVDLFEDGSQVCEEDVEARLLQVMQDEFNVDVDDDSACENARDIMIIYQECRQGNYEPVTKLQLRHHAHSTTPIQIVVEGCDNPDDDDEASDASMEVDETTAEPQPLRGPVIDQDGFEMVQNRNGRKS